jgi:hypothetical protein
MDVRPIHQGLVDLGERLRITDETARVTPLDAAAIRSARGERIEEMSIRTSGSAAELPDDPRVSLLDYLREHLQLHGTKKGCDQGACGACTVLVDGDRFLSCLALAIQHEGRSVTTIEGLGPGGALHPLEQSFIEPPARSRPRSGNASFVAGRRHRSLARHMIGASPAHGHFEERGYASSTTRFRPPGWARLSHQTLIGAEVPRALPRISSARAAT